MASNVMMIVPELLTETNYEEWSICVKNYLLAQDLWDVVEFVPPPKEGEDASWRKKNAAVLYALQISCAPEIFGQIKGINSAKDAWGKLAQMNEPKQRWKSLGSGPQSTDGSDLSEVFQWFQGIIPGASEVIERTDCVPLISAIGRKMDWNTIKILLEKHPLATSAGFCRQGFTLLSLAAHTGDLKMCKKLVGLMSLEEMEIQNREGITALTYAAIMCKTEMVDMLIRKNPKALTIPDENGMIPVVMACYHRRKEMTRFLYLRTLIDESLATHNGDHGSLLLHYCLQSEMLST